MFNHVSKPITVVSNVEQNVTLRTTTDRIQYHINDYVEISDLVRNISANSIESGASLLINVTSPDGTNVFNVNKTIGDLTPSYSNSYVDLLVLNNAVVGNYIVNASVLSAGGAVLAIGNIGFTVVNDLTLALDGAVEASAAEVFVGDTLLCTDTLINTGNALASGLQIRQLLINVDAETVISSVELAIDVLAGENAAIEARSIDTTDLGLGNYACALQAFINNTWVNLDNDFFEVLQQPINLELSAVAGEKGRVLVLLDDSRQCTDDPFGPRNAPDLATQQTYLESVLSDAGWSYTITLNDDDFVRELRTGGYSSYLLLAEIERLSHFAQKELREAVYRGEGLVDAGKRLQPHEVADSALGIQHRGQQRRASGVSLLDSELFDPELGSSESLTFTHQDRNVRVTARGAQTVAEYMNGQRAASSHHSDRHWHGYRFFRGHNPYWCPPVQRNSPAITLNEFGLGQAVYMGFDLLSEASSMGSEENAFSALLLSALETVKPEPPLTTVGSDYPVVFTVTNVGSATPAQFVLPVPEGVSVVDAGTAWLTRIRKPFLGH